MEHPMQKLNDLSRSLAPLKPDGTLIAVIEMSQSSWLVAGIVPGVERQPLKKLAADEIALLKLLHRWREEAEKAGGCAEEKNGSAASELRCRCAWLHHGSGPRAHRIQGCGAIDPRPKASSPLIAIPTAPRGSLSSSARSI